MTWSQGHLIELRDHLDMMLEDVSQPVMKVNGLDDEFGRGYFEGIKAVRDDVDGWLPEDMKSDCALKWRRP